MTEGDGNFTAGLDPGRYNARISHEGYRTEEREWTFGTPPDAPVLIGLAKAAPAGFIRTNGHDLVTADGLPYLFACYTVHTMPANLWRGDDVGRIMDEAKSYGYTSLLPICCHRSDWKKANGYEFDPLKPEFKFQETLATMFDMGKARGLGFAPAIIADGQGYSREELLRIWAMACEVMSGRPEIIVARIGNEWGANGYYPMDFPLPDLKGVLCSRGSVGTGAPPFPAYWHVAEWSSRREPTYKAIDDCGAGVLELHNGYTDRDGEQIGPFNCPIIQIEPPYFHHTEFDDTGSRRWTAPKLALALGVNISANCAGGAFGAADSLECRPLQPRAADCAREFLRGLKAGFVR